MSEPAGASLASPVRADAPAPATFAFRGQMGRCLDRVTKHWLLRVPEENPAMLGMIAERNHDRPVENLLPWSGEFAGKYLTAAAEMLRITRSPELRSHLRDFVDRFIALQSPDGYLGPFAKGFELTGKGQGFLQGGNWDLWGHYHAMLALLTWDEVVGDPSALAAARKIADLICEKFSRPEHSTVDTGSVEMNQAPVHALAILYRKTGAARYLAQAEKIIREFAQPGAGDYLRTGVAGLEFFQTPKPRWESLHPLMGLAELATITGHPDYRAAFEHHWRSIQKLDRHNNGGFSSGEQAHGNPYHLAAIETCCTIAWIAMTVEMLRLTADPIVADELEWSTLNQVMALHTPAGDLCTYNTPMNGRRVLSTEDISFQARPGSEKLNCCSVNAARGFGLLGQWAVLTGKDSLLLNYYGASTFRVPVAGTTVQLVQTTSYPRDGHIDLAVDPEQSGRWVLKLRVPHWSTHTRVSVNGEARAARPGTYLELDRAWKPGDRVTIDFDFSPRFWTGERELSGRASVYRGPLLLAFECEAARPLPKMSAGWNGGGVSRTAKTKGAWMEQSFQGDRIRWVGYRISNAGKAQVLIDGQLMAVVDQFAETYQPFAWEKTGLGAGPHLIRIEVLDEKSAAAHDTWVNVTSLEDDQDPQDLTPELEAGEFALVPIPDDGEALWFETKDRAGKTVHLRDYASAGWNGSEYFTWLTIAGVKPAEYTRQHPSRTAGAGADQR